MAHCRLLVLCLITLFGFGFGCISNAHKLKADRSMKGHFIKGMRDISAGGTAGIHSVENELIKSNISASLGPLYGYFITDKLELLAALGVEYEETKYEDSIAPLALDYSRQSNISAAVGTQYNFDSEANVIPYIRIFFGVMQSKRILKQVNIPLIGAAKDERKTTDPYAGLRVGIRYFIAKNISWDAGLGYQVVYYDEDFGEDTEDLSIVFGFAFFF